MFKGKAGSLEYLKSLSLNVPAFQLISHEKFISWGDEQLYQHLQTSLTQENADEVTSAAARFLQSVKVPDLALRPGNLYAVRSSALLEDSSDHSFAGIFETALFVQDVESEIKQVWNSLFSPKALKYCRDKKIHWKNLSMDIVIQEMINGEKSGVMFQADPLGNLSREIIVAGFGIGQGIVDEITDTDRLVLVKDQVLEQHISEKHTCLKYENGSLRKVTLPPELRSQKVLTESELHELLKASRLIAAHSEFYMDIEFTFKDRTLYVLQARPITTFPAKKYIQIFDNSNVAENYPGLSTPLTFSGLKRGYAKNFKSLLRFLGLKESDWAFVSNELDQLVGYWGGQIYYNLNNWYSVYALMPFGAEKAVRSFHEMVGIEASSVIELSKRTFWQKCRITSNILPKFVMFYFRGKSYHADYKHEFRSLYSKYRGASRTAASSFEVIRLLNELDQKYLSIIKIPLLNDFFSSLLNLACRKLALKISPGNGEQLYNDLLSNRAELESSKAIYSLMELAEMVQHDPLLKKHLESSLLPQPQFQKFFDKLKTHFDLYGDRSQWEMKIEVPTARERPETTVKLILDYANAGMTRKEQREKEQEKSWRARKELTARFMKAPVSSILFWHLFKKCSEAISFREDSRFDRVRFKGLNRELVLKLGTKLVEKNWVHSPEDLFYLTHEELMSLNHDSYGATYWMELVELRKKHLTELSTLKLPDRILTNEVVSVKKFARVETPAGSDLMKGVPCSGGEVEAICEVVHDLNQAPSLTDKILVAERTDPAWGYFFVGVRGIIIEKGSQLSHAAIISRELGIPCIINVKDATSALKSGMKIRMNGDSGEITVVKP